MHHHSILVPQQIFNFSLRRFGQILQERVSKCFLNMNTLNILSSISTVRDDYV